MDKNELIQLHTLLAQIKHHMEAEFEEYEELGLEPAHVHRSKTDHKKAVFLLGKGIASTLSEDEFSGPSQVSNRLSELATDTPESSAEEPISEDIPLSGEQVSELFNDKVTRRLFLFLSWRDGWTSLAKVRETLSFENDHLQRAIEAMEELGLVVHKLADRESGNGERLTLKLTDRGRDFAEALDRLLTPSVSEALTKSSIVESAVRAAREDEEEGTEWVR